MAININIPSQFLDYNNLAAFPATGSAKILYVAKDTNKLYRWSGTAYVEVSASQASSWGSITGNLASQTDLVAELDAKVPKETGKGLSTNDYTTTEKNKLAGIAAGAEVNVNADWNATSGDAQILNKPTIPSIAGLATTSYVDSQDATKQDVLVSGTNIKTINGTTVLGSGDITIGGSGVTNVTGTSPISSSGGTTPAISIANASTSTTGALTSTDWNTFNGKQAPLVSGTNIKTVNSTSVLGSGDIAVQPTLVSGTNIKTINGNSVLGSGDLTISGGSGLSGIHAVIKPKTGTAILPIVNGNNTTTITANNGRLIAYPFIPATSFTSTGLSINVLVLIAGGLARVCIYDDLNGAPNALLVASANLDCSTGGLKTFSNSFNFVAGTTYWLCTHFNNGCQVSAITTASMLPVASSPVASTLSFGYYQMIAFGTTPNPFTGTTPNTANSPLIFIQV